MLRLQFPSSVFVESGVGGTESSEGLLITGNLLDVDGSSGAGGRGFTRTPDPLLLSVKYADDASSDSDPKLFLSPDARFGALSSDKPMRRLVRRGVEPPLLGEPLLGERLLGEGEGVIQETCEGPRDRSKVIDDGILFIPLVAPLGVLLPAGDGSVGGGGDGGDSSARCFPFSTSGSVCSTPYPKILENELNICESECTLRRGGHCPAFESEWREMGQRTKGTGMGRRGLQCWRRGEGTLVWKFCRARVYGQVAAWTSEMNAPCDNSRASF